MGSRRHPEFENLRAEIEGGKRKTAVAAISGIRSDAFRSGLATLAFRCDNNRWLPPEVRTSRRRVAQKRRRRCKALPWPCSSSVYRDVCGRKLEVQIRG